jgi:hypothetical protein
MNHGHHGVVHADAHLELTPLGHDMLGAIVSAAFGEPDELGEQFAAPDPDDGLTD